MDTFSRSIIGTRQYSAQSKTSAFFQNETLTHFYSSLASPAAPSVAMMDVSSCFSASDQIFIKVKLEFISKNLSVFRLQNMEYSVRILIASMANVSPSQIRNINFERFKMILY